MTVRRFTLDGLPRSPWKNGGGTTREVACWPPGAGLDSFDWRVSIATIAAEGPFSAFPGIDRTITLLDGTGVWLRSRDASIDHKLDQLLVPFRFPGEAALDCELLDGASSDLNVMARRGRLRAEVRVVRSNTDLAAAPHGLLLAIQGRWTVNLGHDAKGALQTLRLASTDGIWWGDTPRAFALEASSPDASLIAVTFRQPAAQ